MKSLLSFVCLSLFASQVFAASCEEQATSKKLAGAAKTSFVSKCEKDLKASGAKEACEAQAKDKKLAGAAKNSFVSKCEKDAAK